MVDSPFLSAPLRRYLRDRHLAMPVPGLLWAVLLVFFLTASADARIMDVPREYGTIQKAIDAAEDGDEIIVAPGRYVENIHMLGKDIVLRSTNPQDFATVEATIIDGNHAGTVVTFLGLETRECVVSGFTITNGWAHQGGGFHGSNGDLFPDLPWARPTIEYNIIRNNRCGSDTQLVWSEGGGIYRCRGVIRGNVIVENEAPGLEICDDWPYDCEFSAGYGGALDSCTGLIEHNLFARNRANYASAFYVGKATIRGNIVVENLGTSCIWGVLGDVFEENVVINNEIGEQSGAIEGFTGDILNNVITGNTGYGLLSVAKDGRVEGNYIANNRNEVAGSNYQIWGARNVWRNAIVGTRSDKLVRVLAGCRDVRYNVIFDNASSALGGLVLGDCEDIIGNIICANTFARSIFVLCRGKFYNNTIFGNSTQNVKGLFEDSPNLDIRNCIFWNNTTPTGVLFPSGLTPIYSCIENDASGEPTNISLDPKFVDPENGDFSLQPDSPCIDAGAYVPEAAFDILGRPRGFDGSPEPRGDGSDFDIGAFEFFRRVVGEGEGEGEAGLHSADIDGNGRIAMHELLRVIQFYNARGYHCAEGTEDGYAPGEVETDPIPWVNPLEVARSPLVEAYMEKHNIELPEIPEEHITLWRAVVTGQWPSETKADGCVPHSSDYFTQDWRIALTELLRLIQFYNTPGGYHPCLDSEDGFCPGAGE